MFELNVSDRAVIEAGVAKDMAQRVWFGDVAAGLADDDGQLALVIEISRNPRAHHRLIVRDKGVDQAQKTCGFSGGAPPASAAWAR